MLSTDGWHKNWVHCKILRGVYKYFLVGGNPHTFDDQKYQKCSAKCWQWCVVLWRVKEKFFFLWRIFLAFHVSPLYIFWLYLVATLGLAIYILNLSIYSGQYFTTSLLKFSVLSTHFLIFSLLYSTLQDLSFWNVIIYNIIIEFIHLLSFALLFS